MQILSLHVNFHPDKIFFGLSFQRKFCVQHCRPLSHPYDILWNRWGRILFQRHKREKSVWFSNVTLKPGKSPRLKYTCRSCEWNHEKLVYIYWHTILHERTTKPDSFVNLVSYTNVALNNSHGMREFRPTVSIQLFYWSSSNIRPFSIVASSSIHSQCEREWSSFRLSFPHQWCQLPQPSCGG
jgi:hypothetical protein